MQRLDAECFHYLESHPAIRHDGAAAERVRNLYAVVLAAGDDTQNIYRSQIMYLLMRHILLNICDKVRRSHIRDQETGSHRKRELYDRFVKLVAGHFIERRDVAFYAEKLCISMSYLASVTRTLTGETPKETIDKWIVHEIKLMLMFSDLTLQQIADRMHFPDQSYLGRYFKRHTGSSPVLSATRNDVPICAEADRDPQGERECRHAPFVAERSGPAGRKRPAFLHIIVLIRMQLHSPEIVSANSINLFYRILRSRSHFGFRCSYGRLRRDAIMF